MITTLISSILAFTFGATIMYYYHYQNIQQAASTPCKLDYLDQDGNKLITSNQAKEMYENYTSNRVNPIVEHEKQQRNGKKFSPTRYASYSWSEFNDYIDYIKCVENLLKRDTIYKDGIQSLRIYFAQYPNSTKFKSVDEVIGVRAAKGQNDDPADYQGRNTIFILPTLQNGKEEHAFEFNIDNNDKIGITNLFEFKNKIPQNFKPPNFMANVGTPGMIPVSESHSTILNEAGLTPPPH